MLRIEQGGDGREPMLRMIRRKGDAPLPSPPAPPSPSPVEAPAEEPAVNAAQLIRRTLAGLSNKATAGILTDETLETLRAECPGWDYQTLHQQFRDWIDGSPERTPVNYQRAFIGYVRQHHAKNRHLVGR
jgi:hypothetical protein